MALGIITAQLNQLVQIPPVVQPLLPPLSTLIYVAWSPARRLPPRLCGKAQIDLAREGDRDESRAAFGRWTDRHTRVRMRQLGTSVLIGDGVGERGYRGE